MDEPVEVVRINKPKTRVQVRYEDGECIWVPYEDLEQDWPILLHSFEANVSKRREDLKRKHMQEKALQAKRAEVQQTKQAGDGRRNASESIKYFSKFDFPKNDVKGMECVILVLGGSFAPIHQNHIRMLKTARTILNKEKPNLHVVGSLLVPSHSSAITKKFKPVTVPSALSAANRVNMCRAATSTEPWIDTYDALAMSPRNFGQQGALIAIERAARQCLPSSNSVLRVMTVCGADSLPRVRSAYANGVVCVVNRAVDYDVRAFASTQKGLILVGDDFCEEMSSTEVRRAWQERNENRLRVLLHPNVLEYHKKNQLDYGQLGTAQVQVQRSTAKDTSTSTSSAPAPAALVDADDEKALKYSEKLLRQAQTGINLPLIVYNDIVFDGSVSSGDGNPIGAGVSCTVFRGACHGRRVAVKKLDLDFRCHGNGKERQEKADKAESLRSQGGSKTIGGLKTNAKERVRMNADSFKRECFILQKLQENPLYVDIHISQCLGWATHELSLFLVLEEADMALQAYLNANRGQTSAFPDRATLQILADVAEAGAFLHESRVVHRDLTVDNILVRQNRGVLCDFGVARHADETCNVLRGNLRRYAPEAIRHRHTYEKAADIYMFGVVCVEVYCDGQEIWPHLSNPQAITLTLAGVTPALLLEDPLNAAILEAKMMVKLGAEVGRESEARLPSTSQLHICARDTMERIRRPSLLSFRLMVTSMLDVEEAVRPPFIVVLKEFDEILSELKEN